jgi:ABC-type phosphate transport system substrate-binding protein
MMKKKLFIVLLLFSVTADAGLVVIANLSVGDGASDRDIKKVFIGKKSELAGGVVIPVDQKEGSIMRKWFYETVVGQTEDEVKAYRTEMVFTGKGVSPKILDDDLAVKAFVATTPGAIGYIDESKIDYSVKVILKPKNKGSNSYLGITQ